MLDEQEISVSTQYSLGNKRQLLVCLDNVNIMGCVEMTWSDQQAVEIEMFQWTLASWKICIYNVYNWHCLLGKCMIDIFLSNLWM